MHLKAHAMRFGKRLQQHVKESKRQCKEARKLRFSKAEDKHKRNLYSALSTSQSQPLLAARRSAEGPKGEPPGSIATDPKEVDDIAVDAGTRVYNGNTPDVMRLVHNFLDKYRKYIPKPPDTKHNVQDLDGPSLQYATRIAPNTSQGLGNVYRQDLKLLNLTAKW